MFLRSILYLEEGGEPGPGVGALLPAPATWGEILQELGMNQFCKSRFCFSALEVCLPPASREPGAAFREAVCRGKILFLSPVLGPYVTPYDCWQTGGPDLGRLPRGLEARPAAILALLGNPGFGDALLTRGPVTPTTAPGPSLFAFFRKIKFS